MSLPSTLKTPSRDQLINPHVSTKLNTIHIKNLVGKQFYSSPSLVGYHSDLQLYCQERGPSCLPSHKLSHFLLLDLIQSPYSILNSKLLDRRWYRETSCLFKFYLVQNLKSSNVFLTFLSCPFF